MPAPLHPHYTCDDARSRPYKCDDARSRLYTQHLGRRLDHTLSGSRRPCTGVGRICLSLYTYICLYNICIHYVYIIPLYWRGKNLPGPSRWDRLGEMKLYICIHNITHTHTHTHTHTNTHTCLKSHQLLGKPGGPVSLSLLT
jgi:hypothetical protein